MSVSVLILTLNEEINIAGCLDAVAWSDDVVVLDSFSSDATLEIARQHGARVVQRKFDNYAAQRNYGLDEVPFRHPWVLMVDADERVPETLREEIENCVRNAPESTSLYEMRRKDYLYGRWLRRSSGYPTWFGRLLRVGRVRFDRAFNEQPRTEGDIAQLREHLHHYPFNAGFSAWIAKHNRYSTMEAALLADGIAKPFRAADLFVHNAQRRRNAAKALLYRIPARPLVAFLGLYLVRGGIFDGRAGLTFSLLRTWYEYMIDCKSRELSRRGRGLPV